MTDLCLEPITIKGDHGRQPFVYQGWLVPETERLFAVDERYEGDWAITHLPTTHSVFKYGYTHPTTREDAIGIARRFYREALKRNWDLRSTAADSIVSPHNALTTDEREAFWKAVRGDAT